MEQTQHPRRRRASSTERVEATRAPYINRKLSTFSVLSEDGLALIEANADTILHETGMEFVGDPEILAIFKEAGCDVQDTRVRFERGFCRKTIQATAPKSFTQHARNPANNVVMGGNNSVLCPSWGPPFVHDLDKGRRYATYADFTNLVKLAGTLPWLHHSGRHDVGAGGPARQQAPSRHALCAHPLFRPGLHGRFHRSGTRGKCRRHGTHRFWRRLCSEQSGALLRVKHQCAAGAGFPYVRRIENLCAGQPAGGLHAVGADRRDEPDHGGWNLGAGAGRSHGLSCAGATDQSRRALPDGQFCFHHVHAIRCAHIRHAGSRPDGACCRSTGAAFGRATAYGRHIIRLETA